MKLHFIKAGLQSLVQDKGRIGYQAFGVPTAGPMDKLSAKIANWLLDLPERHPVLEISLMGPTIAFEGSGQIALTGADLSAKLNDQAMPMYETVDVKSDDVLSFAKPISGCRAYLGIRGNWKTEAWLDSQSSFFLGRNESIAVNAIKNGSFLTIEALAHINKRKYPFDRLSKIETETQIRVLAGPEFEAFSPYNIADFFSITFTLSNDSNRMGYRINPVLEAFHPQHELISSGTVPGTIQISNSGQPIILMADSQTSGGYFRIANVITADMPKLGQLKARDKVRFRLVRREEALQALREQDRLLDF